MIQYILKKKRPWTMGNVRMATAVRLPYINFTPNSSLVFPLRSREAEGNCADLLLLNYFSAVI